MRNALLAAVILTSTAGIAQNGARIYVEPHTLSDGTHVPGFWMDVQPKSPYDPSIYHFKSGDVVLPHAGTEILLQGMQRQAEIQRQLEADPEYQRRLAEQAAYRQSNRSRRMLHSEKQRKELQQEKVAQEYERVQRKNREAQMTPEEREAEKVRQDAAKANELKAIEEGRRKFIADIDFRLKHQLIDPALNG